VERFASTGFLPRRINGKRRAVRDSPLPNHRLRRLLGKPEPVKFDPNARY